MRKWYAVQTDRDDTDWGYGSYDLDEAKEMLKAFPNGLIAVIEEGDDPICIEEIPYSDIYQEEDSVKQIKIGTIYSDPLGIWRVDDVNEKGVTITLIAMDALNAERTYEGVRPEEVAKYIKEPFDEHFNEFDYIDKL